MLAEILYHRTQKCPQLFFSFLQASQFLYKCCKGPAFGETGPFRLYDPAEGRAGGLVVEKVVRGVTVGQDGVAQLPHGIIVLLPGHGKGALNGP